MRTTAVLLLALMIGFGSAALPGEAFADGILTERTYKRLARIHELMGENQYDEALTRLDHLVKSVRRNKYEYALVMQTYGYVYAAKEQYRKAAEAFEACLEQEALPEGPTRSTLYTLAQLYMTIGNFQGTVDTLNRWFQMEKEPKAEAFAFLGTAHAQLKQYDKAIENMKIAISRAEKPQETWYQIVLAIYFEQKRYAEAAETLEQMIRLWPDKKQYWTQLAGVYFNLKRDMRSLSVMELAYRKGYLTTEKELLNLANLYQLLHLPYKAGKIMEEGIRRGIIEPTTRNWQRLSDAWFAARELKPSLVALRKAAELSDDGELYLRAAQISAEGEDWPAVIEDLRLAEEKDALKDPGLLYLLKGTAYYELKKYNDALQAFADARKYDSSAENAEQWINYVNSELAMLQ